MTSLFQHLPFAMTAEQKQLHKTYRSQVTTFSKKCIDYVEANDSIKAQATFEMLHECYDKLQSATLACRAGAELGEEELDKDIHDELLYTEKFKLAKFSVASIKAAPVATPVAPPAAPTVPSVKLERLKLPTFNGDLLQFTEFWPAFKARVHQSQSLAAPDKFEYLKTSLSGPALAVIQGLSHDETGYANAIKLLMNRYGRRSPLINSHVQKLLSMPALTDQSSVTCMRSQCDQLYLAIRNLQSLGVKVENSKELLGPVLLNRLPHSMQIKWREQHRSDDLDTIDDPKDNVISVEDLLSFFSSQIDHLELSPKAPVQEHRPKSPFKPKYKHASNTLHVEGKGKRKPCPICSLTNHGLVYSCPTLLKASPSDRREMVRKCSLCFNCLSSGHHLSDCKSELRCKHCDQAHHSLLCRKPAGKQDAGANGTNMFCEDRSSNEGVYPTLLAYAVHAGQRRKVRLLLDGCSNHTFVSSSLAKEMRFPVTRRSPLTVSHFNKGSVHRTFDVCRIQLQSLFSRATLTISAFATEVCHPLSGPAINVSRLSHTRGLSFSEDYSSRFDRPIDILIGFDYLYDLLTDSVRRGARGEPVALSTRFGWTLHGPYSWQALRKGRGVARVFHAQVRDPMYECLERFTDLELIGVKPEEEAPSSWPKPALVDGRFEISLPWRSSSRPTSNLERVKPYQSHVYRRLSSSKAEEYRAYFRELADLSIVKPCDLSPSGSCWFLPHHPVWQKGKMRVVFDGSSGRPPLNQLLETGPNLLQKLPVCITSFRLRKIPLVADIEKAFLQIGVVEEDRDFLKFLIRKDGEFHAFRFYRTPFGLCCSPALLNTCLQDLYRRNEDAFPSSVQTLRESMYCDDFVASFDSPSDIARCQEDCSKIFSSASLNLRGWSQHPTSVLGLQYSSDGDAFSLDLDPFISSKSSPFSRRRLAASIAKIFDPMGFLVPWTLRGKLLIQRAWDSSHNWDDPLPDDLLLDWQNLVHEARTSNVVTPRYLGLSGHCSIHAFSDASQSSYSTVLYLVSHSFSRIMFARSRLVPSKSKTSIPRLELLGAMLSVRAVKMLTSSLQDLQNLTVYFWTDSTCVLSWIDADPNTQKQFVKNRVVEIHSVPGTWRYCPGTCNPADLATRGTALDSLSHPSLWTEGPPWLLNESSWPVRPQVVPDSPVVQVLQISVEESGLEAFMRRYSSLRALESVFCWFRRFQFNSLASSTGETRREGLLSHRERSSALELLIRRVQLLHFSAEIQSLSSSSDRGVPHGSRLRCLRPFLHSTSGLLYALPRTGEDPLLVLPPESHLSRLIINDVHIRLFHAGVDRVMCQVQRSYWILRLRKLVRSQLRTCTRCQRYQNRPYRSPEGFLAPFRGGARVPFAHTGLDFMGPLTVDNNRKVYILIFTCACVRAVHLETTPNMSFQSTERAFRRFLSRRGVPQYIYSDNALAFRKLSASLSIPWRTIPERSPWWGGWWERLVGVVKGCLRKSLHLSHLTGEELSTVVCEVESAMNCRPLTYVSDSPDSVSPLRPMDFLSVSTPLCEPRLAYSGPILGARWRHRQLVVNRLLGRWKQEYLTSLRGWRRGRSQGKLPSVGDVVIVKSGPHRAEWPLAVVKELLVGQDGHTRAAVVSIKGQLTRRAVSLLYPLEANSPWSGVPGPDSPPEEESSSPSSDDEVDSPPVSSQVSRRGRQIRLPARLQD